MSFVSQLLEQLQEQLRARQRQELQLGLLTLITANTWDDSQQLLEQHPELLSEEAAEALEALMREEEVPSRRRLMERHRLLLRRCRELGIGPALRELTTTPPVFQDDFHRLEDAGARFLRSRESKALDSQALHEAVAAWKRILHPRPWGKLEEVEPSGDAERAAELFLYAKTQLPAGSRSFYKLIHALCKGLLEAQAPSPALDDLENAIALGLNALTWIPPGSEELPALFTDLGHAWELRYGYTRALVDLENAIYNYHQAAPLVLPDTPQGKALLRRLASLSRERYLRLGDAADLERARQAYIDILGWTSPHSPEVLDLFAAWGEILQLHYARTHELLDLKQALAVYEDALKLARPESPARPALLHNLGKVLHERARHLSEYLASSQEPVDLTVAQALEEALHALEESVARTPRDSPALPGRLADLSAVLHTRHEQTQEPADLERALGLWKQAAESCPPESPERPALLCAWSRGLLLQHQRTQDAAALEQALQLMHEVMDRTPPDSPQLLERLELFGTLLAYHHAHTREEPLLAQALQIFERTWSLLQTALTQSPVDYKLGQQRTWARFAGDFAALLLLRAAEQPSSAAADRQRALEVIEGSKSRLLTELLGRRGLAAPPGIAPEQLRREHELLEALNQVDARELGERGNLVTHLFGLGRMRSSAQRQALHQELEALWQGMARWGEEAAHYVALRRNEPPRCALVARAVREAGEQTALLSLFPTRDRTLLFILREGQEQPVALQSGLEAEGWEDLLRRLTHRVHVPVYSGHSVETWAQALLPLLQEATPHLEGVTRLVLSPAGLGHLLPWPVLAERAGWSAREGHPLPLVVVPTLGVLPYLRAQTPSRRPGSALVAGNPRPQEAKEALPYAEYEARAVGTLLGSPALLGPQMTRKALLERMPGASLIHLATHARFRPDSPLDSSLLLADGELTAREFLGLRLQADLVVLSACQTGTSGPLGGEELAGLAQAFLYAGARSLVVSLWNVADTSTAALATAFYEALAAGRDKARALLAAMSHVRSQAHWSHPHYWGAFVLMGDWRIVPLSVRPRRGG